MDNNKNYALVTGGTSGIGYELCKLLAKDGYNLVIVARNESDLVKVADELTAAFSVDVVTLSKDLFDPQHAFEVYEELMSKGIRVDILINDAGQGQYGEFRDTDIRRELSIINLNISSLVVLTKLFLKDMLGRNEGRIMNLSSIAGKVPGPWQAVYHGTKAFVQSFTEAVRAEVKDSNVTITALLPGATDTDFFDKAGMLDSKQVVEGKLDNARKVAEDGYHAMMIGDDMVVSGFKNKMMVTMAAVTSDETLANKMYKQQAPVEQEK